MIRKQGGELGMRGDERASSPLTLRFFGKFVMCPDFPWKTVQAQYHFI